MNKMLEAYNISDHCFAIIFEKNNKNMLQEVSSMSGWLNVVFFCCSFTMSELFMECVEEELEPWQKQVPEVQLIEDDDDEPIFVGVLCNVIAHF